MISQNTSAYLRPTFCASPLQSKVAKTSPLWCHTTTRRTLTGVWPPGPRSRQRRHRTYRTRWACQTLFSASFAAPGPVKLSRDLSWRKGCKLQLQCLQHLCVTKREEIERCDECNHLFVTLMCSCSCDPAPVIHMLCEQVASSGEGVGTQAPTLS